MMLVLALAAVGAVSSAALKEDKYTGRAALEKHLIWQWNPADDAAYCRSGFNYYEGWCLYVSSPNEYVYQSTVTICENLGVHTPSLHSQNDLDFWTTFVAVTGIYHFWLDAFCPSSGQPFIWKDGTPMDYMGPNGQLQQCQVGYGYHLHTEGFEEYDYNTEAPALCAYPANEAQTTLEPAPTPIDVRESYCSCNPSSVYLDIVFIIDASSDMTSKTLGDAAATIQSTLYGLTFGTEYFQSNIAALVFADKVQVVRNFGDFKSTTDINTFSLPYLGGKANKMTEAIQKASSMISANGRDFTRGVIVLLSKSFNQMDAMNIQEAADAFQNDGGVFISIDYAKGMGIKGLRYVASPGFYIQNGQSQNNLDAEILYAFCDANCFCPDGLYPYDIADDKDRQLPQGCYHIADVAAVYDAAEQNCLNQKGFVATVHDDAKNFFMLSIFPPKARYWLGIKKSGKNFEWTDGSGDHDKFWAPENPVAGLDCVYGQQLSGFNSPWYSAPCTDPLKNSLTYACQLRPCDSEYDCRA